MIDRGPVVLQGKDEDVDGRRLAVDAAQWPTKILVAVDLENTLADDTVERVL